MHYTATSPSVINVTVQFCLSEVLIQINGHFRGSSCHFQCKHCLKCSSFALECPSEKLLVFCKGKEFPAHHAHTVPKSARYEEAEAEILDSSCVGSLTVYSIQDKSILLSPHYRSGCVTCLEMRRQCSSITALSPTEPPVVEMIQKWKKLSRCLVNSGCLQRCVSALT